MRNCLFLCFLGLAWAAPQTYSDQAAPLTDDDYAPLTDSSNVDVLVQVVKEAESQYPSNYVEPDSSNLVKDEANVEIDTVFENCDQYTEEFGYECVPYYQCHNGTIITDGAGLIDIRNGFASLTPDDSKCPGFLD